MAEQDNDIDPQETGEGLAALDSILQQEGVERAHYILEQLIARARKSGAYLPYSANTAYLNTIPQAKQVPSPGNHELEDRLRALVRWNALVLGEEAGRG